MERARRIAVFQYLTPYVQCVSFCQKNDDDAETRASMYPQGNGHYRQNAVQSGYGHSHFLRRKQFRCGTDDDRSVS